MDALTKKARERRIKLGHLLLGLQHLIDSGENGDQCTFWEWFDEMCPGRSRSDAEHLMTIARQPDPDAAYDRRLGKQKEYVERHWRKKLGAPPLKAEDAPPSEAEDASEITDQTPAEREFFPPPPKPKPHYTSAEGDDALLDDLESGFRQLSWNGLVRWFKREHQLYNERKRGRA